MAARIQSPSSINTYKQCPRKYYYQYILRLPTIKSIHLIRGKIIHSVLQDFFKIDINSINTDYIEFELNILLQSTFKQKWNESIEELMDLRIGQTQLEFYYNESQEMINSWFESFLNRIQLRQNDHLTFKEAFKILIPETEVHFLSNRHQVQGYVDAIHNVNGEISLMDYKTSKKDEISDEYRLQLAIYALLYYEKYGRHPDLVGIDFLKHGPKYIKVDKKLLDLAEKECVMIHENTKSNEILEYPLNPGPLCKWSTGQCDFYDICFGQKKIEDFK